ncbi:MAG: UDP-glucose 4-epimerase GalE [Candidatus Nanopelagicales bacterium]|nr:UDP-glucose 4-epimerase GalE [Actinomycetota bacterium]MBT5806854.1 UDP-glucose 4-epimerase GalE [Actinomycetota bacterium]MDC1474294.1 UDP-glucose 4-epimerase GalE [Candidatus Nanopelagicales bacterium]
MSTWLVTGGAGYIGSHVVRELLSAGFQPVVCDDFSAGLRSRIPEDVPIVEGDIADATALRGIFNTFGVTGVVHLAAKKAAGESVHFPLHYYKENVTGLQSVLGAMVDSSVDNFVYSSSAAVYGTPQSNPVKESEAFNPESPYGETKVIGEWLAKDLATSNKLNWIALRYFNVAGAGSDDLGDNSVNNLIPMVFQALEIGGRPRIFGADYPTPDGTCIRDYIHVVDLAGAHVAAVKKCETGRANLAINVGRGSGVSVQEVMDSISRVIGRDINPEVVGRRAGDPPASFADVKLSETELAWSAERDLHDMVSSAWSAWQSAHR